MYAYDLEILNSATGNYTSVIRLALSDGFSQTLKDNLIKVYVNVVPGNLPEEADVFFRVHDINLSPAV